jgi:hypothetical protein
MIVGIVGKANVGKSTFFKALTLADIEIANYPFATIDPNKGVGHVKIERVDREFDRESTPRAGFTKGDYRFVPVNVIDVAGLVPGAHEGKGLGSQFLSDLNRADVLIHVIDASGGTNEKGEPVPTGSYDPANDIRFLEDELDHWYKGILQDGWEKFMRRVKAEHLDAPEAVAHQMSGVGVTEEIADDVLDDDLDMESVTHEELLEIAAALRKRTKPMVIAANKADVDGASETIERLRDEFPDHTIVPCSAESELALKEAEKHDLVHYIPGEDTFTVEHDVSDEQRNGLDFIQSYLDEAGTTGVQDCLNTAVLDVLGYKAVFPGGLNNLEDSEGRVLPDCFLMPADATAIDFAYELHSDFGENFVKAIDVKQERPVGKDHVLEHRDVIEIKSG